MTPRRSLRAVLGAGLAALTLTLVACGGDDEGASDTTASADTTAAVAATTEPAVETTAAPGTSDATNTTTAAPDSTAAASDTASDASAGESADREAYVEAGVAAFNGVEGDTAECLVNAVIDGAGFETISSTGLSPEEFWGPGTPLADAGLTPESPEVTAVAEGVAACDGVLDAFAASAGEDITAEQTSCMEEGGALELLGQSLALGMIGADPSEVAAEGEALSAECGLS